MPLSLNVHTLARRPSPDARGALLLHATPWALPCCCPQRPPSSRPPTRVAFSPCSPSPPSRQVDFVWGQLTALQQFYEARWGGALPVHLPPAPARRATGHSGTACCSGAPLFPTLTTALRVPRPRLCRLAVARESGEPEPSALYRLEFAGGEQEQQQQQPGEEAPPPPPPPQQEQQGSGQPPADAPAQEQQLEQQADGSANQQDGVQPPAAAQQAGSRAERDAALQSLDRSLRQVWEAAPGGTLVVVVTGQGDTTYSRWAGAGDTGARTGVLGRECSAAARQVCPRRCRPGWLSSWARKLSCTTGAPQGVQH